MRPVTTIANICSQSIRPFPSTLSMWPHVRASIPIDHVRVMSYHGAPSFRTTSARHHALRGLRQNNLGKVIHKISFPAMALCNLQRNCIIWMTKGQHLGKALMSKRQKVLLMIKRLINMSVPLIREPTSLEYTSFHIAP